MRSRLASAPFVFAAAISLAAQQPSFRSGANYVRVDMSATRDGAPVEDLRIDEIELLEDGTRQTIERFEHVKVRPTGAQPSADDGWARVFVIFLDTYHLQVEASANTRLPLVRFLDRLLGQDDMVALMTPEMSADDLTFGRKTTVISNIMQPDWTWGRRGRATVDSDPKEKLYNACFPDSRDTQGLATEMKDRRREQLTLDALDDLVITLRGLRDERKAVITVSEGWQLFRENRNLARRIRGGATGVDMNECETDRVAMAVMDNERRIRDLTDAANRANVTFYTVSPSGLALLGALTGPNRPLTNLRELADNTDGFGIVSTNDVEDGLRRIIADLSSYYLIGYHSINTKLDGRFRTITVRVRRPDVQVRARRGYRGLTPDELLTTRNGAAAPASAVGVVVNPRATFRIRTSLWAPRVWVVGELDYSARKELAWSAGAQADVVIAAADGTEITTTTVDVLSGEGAFALQVPEEVRIAAGEYAVRVRLRPNGQGLPVTDTVRLVVPDAPSALGEPVLWRRGPSTGPRYLVTADPRFQRSDRIRLEVPTGLAGPATARMVDRNGSPMQIPVQVTDRADPSGSFRWIVVDATLAPLAAGDYGIEVTLGQATQLGVFKVVP